MYSLKIIDNSGEIIKEDTQKINVEYVSDFQMTKLVSDKHTYHFSGGDSFAVKDTNIEESTLFRDFLPIDTQIKNALDQKHQKIIITYRNGKAVNIYYANQSITCRSIHNKIIEFTIDSDKLLYLYNLEYTLIR